MTKKKPHILILGAGPAGVGAAYRLVKQEKADVTILEARDRVGGNAASFKMNDIYLDYGSHRLHPACKPEILDEIKMLLGDNLLKRPRHGRIRLNNRWIHFPIKASDLVTKLSPGFSLGVFSDMIKKAIPKNKNGFEGNGTFESVLRDKLGDTICEEFYFPYAKKIWGLEANQISSIQAYKRVSANSFSKLIKKVIHKSTGRSGEKGSVFYYPRHGYGEISEAYYQQAKELGADFRFGSRVNGLHTNGEIIESVGFEHGGEQNLIKADLIWSTLPLTLTAKMVTPEPDQTILEASTSMRFRSMVLIYLFLEEARFTEFDAHYFPEEQIPITRLSETKNYNGTTTPENLTCICAELPCSTEDAYWSMDSKEAELLVKESLQRAGLSLDAPVREVSIKRIKEAYPIYDLGFEKHLETLNDYLGQFENMILFGRQGLFVHDNTHHALQMAYSAVKCLDSEGSFDHRKWKSYLKEFESHVVED